MKITLNFFNLILGVFFPEAFVVADGRWNEIQKKIRKSIIYIVISILIIVIMEYIDLPLENQANLWAIIISFSLGAFGGLLFISGLRDILLKLIPGTSKTTAFLFVISSLSIITYGVIYLSWN